MGIKGTITQLKARINASGDRVQTLSLEVFGDFSALSELMEKPLDQIERRIERKIVRPMVKPPVEIATAGQTEER